MAQSFQKSVIALLLCAPSDLHKMWAVGNTAGWERELERLQLSPAAIAAAKTVLATMKSDAGKVAKVQAVMPLLRDDVWGGGEPHPDPPGALRLALAARALDGD